MCFFNLKYGLDLGSADIYKKSLVFQGDFINSITAIKELMENISKEYKSRIFKLKVNTVLEAGSTRLFFQNKAAFSKYLSSSQNVLYKGKSRPESWIIYKNERYNVLDRNCLQLSAKMLTYGTHRTNDHAFKKALNHIIFYEKVPNWAYDYLKKKNLH